MYPIMLRADPNSVHLHFCGAHNTSSIFGFRLWRSVILIGFVDRKSDSSFANSDKPPNSIQPARFYIANIGKNLLFILTKHWAEIRSCVIVIYSAYNTSMETQYWFIVSYITWCQNNDWDLDIQRARERITKFTLI